jgi:hypothetical protein
VAKQPEIVLDQMDNLADQLISQLCSFKKQVADLREQMAEVSTPALGNGKLSDDQVAALLNRREKTLAKRFK